MTEIFNNPIVNGDDPAKVVQVQQPVEGLEFQVSSVLNRLEEAAECHPGDDSGPQFESFRHHMFNQEESRTFPAMNTHDVLNIIQDLFLVEESSDEEEPGVITALPKLNDVAKLTLTSHSLIAYCKFLNNDHAVKISNKIHIDTCNLLNTLFRTNYPGAFFSQNSLEGIVKIFRLLLVTKYPHYNEEGYETLRNKYPVIYVSHDAAVLAAHYICKQLSLPTYCIRRVPVDPSTPSVQKIDPGELETNIREDAAAGKLPFFVLAEVGSSLNGHVDSVTALHEVCVRHDVWLHLRGHNLAALALPRPAPGPALPAPSLSLPLGPWLNLPCLPTITLFSGLGGVGGQDFVAPPLSLQSNEKASALPVWTALKSLGQAGVEETIGYNFGLVEGIRKKLDAYDCLRVLSHYPSTGLGLADVTSKVLPPQTLFESVQSCVLFQFIPKDHPLAQPVPPYFDKLNSWLGQILQRDVPSISLNLTETSAYGTVLRICPFDGSSGGDYESFLVCLEAQVEILVATVAHKASFQSLVGASPRLQPVEMPGWAGLGGVRYVPPAWGAADTDQAKAELNRLNVQVVRTLRTSDAAFSLGEGTDGLACVRFGMVTAETDITELLTLVEETGQQEEESWKFIDSMAEVVKQGILAATQDLQKENEDKLWQEGILRHVPVFGSLVNWWSPVDKDPTRLKGRTLDLTAGRIETTENIYKYHAQATPSSTPTPQLTPQLTPPIGKTHEETPPPPAGNYAAPTENFSPTENYVAPTGNFSPTENFAPVSDAPEEPSNPPPPLQA